VFAHFLTLPAPTQAIVRRWVTEMANGMRKFVFLYPDGIRIQTLEEFREYCYYVAGHGGLPAHRPVARARRRRRPPRYERLRERCRAFGEALQTVNILKDVAHDAVVENSIYVPEQLLREHGSGAGRAALAADREVQNRAPSSDSSSSRGPTSRRRALPAADPAPRRLASASSASCRCSTPTPRCATSRAARRCCAPAAR
jgi:hypothetical protein